MQLKLSTDYAIRIVLYLSMKKQGSSIDELCKNIGIEKIYTIKFLKKLHSVGIVKIMGDKDYSIYLAKDPRQITMFEIIKVMENTIKINICLDEDEYCSCSATKHCPVRKFYDELQNNIENVLKNKTIYDLLKDQIIVNN